MKSRFNPVYIGLFAFALFVCHAASAGQVRQNGQDGEVRIIDSPGPRISNRYPKPDTGKTPIYGSAPGPREPVGRPHPTGPGNHGRPHPPGPGNHFGRPHPSGPGWNAPPIDHGSRMELDRAKALFKSGDQKNAIAIYSRLANQGMPDAMVELADCYFHGKGVGVDWAAAFSLNSRAAEMGHPRGISNVGMAYRLGYGAPMDFAEAARWFMRAAQMGDAGGQFELGQYYYLGFGGIPQNSTRARYWYGLSKKQGNKKAADMLKMMDSLNMW